MDFTEAKRQARVMRAAAKDPVVAKALEIAEQRRKMQQKPDLTPRFVGETRPTAQIIADTISGKLAELNAAVPGSLRQFM